MSTKHVVASVMEITPKLAATWLEKIAPGTQRPLAPAHVEALAQEMAEGRWALNGESIVLNGEMPIDGQHRLHAVVQSGMTIRSVVVSNVAPETFATIDSGRKRAVHDVLGIAGFKATYLTGAVMRWLYAEEQGMLHYTKLPLVPHTEALRLARQHDISQSTWKGNTMASRLLTPSMSVYLHYRFSQVDPVMANNFYDWLETGEGLARTRPVFQLRERLLANRTAKSKYPQRELCALTIKAFNGERAGQRIQHLRWRGEGPQAEPFPVIEG